MRSMMTSQTVSDEETMTITSEWMRTRMMVMVTARHRLSRVHRAGYDFDLNGAIENEKHRPKQPRRRRKARSPCQLLPPISHCF